MDLLSTKIQGPIENVVVHAEEHEHEDEDEDEKKKRHHEDDDDNHGAARINQK